MHISMEISNARHTWLIRKFFASIYKLLDSSLLFRIQNYLVLSDLYCMHLQMLYY